MRPLLAFVLCGLVTSSFGAPPKDGLNAVAERYAHLVLALGQHDPDYLDAFYGPAEWKTQAEKEKQSLEAIAAVASKLMGRKSGVVSQDSRFVAEKLMVERTRRFA